MANKAQRKTDMGYKAYLASFVVMIIIIIAAVCILSGCLDDLIFKPSSQDMASSDTETEALTETDAEGTVTTEIISPETDKVPDVTEKDTEMSETESTSVQETTKEPESKKPTETTRSPETQKEPETSTQEETTKTVDSELDEKEVITEVDNNLKCKYSNGSLTITGYSGSATKVSIARKIDGVSVQSIGDNAFASLTDITEVRISAGIASIGPGAMSDCPALNAVYIPKTVTNIAIGAFDGSDNVTIYCSKGSYAEQYAISNNIKYINN